MSKFDDFTDQSSVPPSPLDYLAGYANGGGAGSDRRFLVGSLGNTRKAVTSGYTVLSTDRGYTLACGGSAFYTVTFNAPSGYAANFSVTVTNEDTARAKFISLSGGTSFYLWPKQSVIVHNQNNVWYVIGQRRWKITTTALTINTDFTNGSDTLGAADGLATTTGAFKTVNYALSMIRDQLDLKGLYDGTAIYTVVTILMASGSTDTTTVHYSASQAAGNFGNSFIIDLNTGTHSGGIECYYGGMAITIQNGTLTGGLSANWGASIFLGASLTFGSPGSGKGNISVSDGGRIQVLNNYTISAAHASGYHIRNLGGYIRVGSITVTVSNNITLAQVVLGDDPGVTDLASVTWSLGGHTVTGQKYLLSGNHVLRGQASVPGSVAGSAGTGLAL